MSDEIGSLSIGLHFDNKSLISSMQSAEKTAVQSAGKMSSAFETASKAIISEVAVRAFDTVVSSATKAASAVTNTISSSVQSFSEYEQLVGGVETLFKDSADIVTQYANDAYKTAGLSANQYMETTTSFSARLLQGLGGDTAEAARIANVAITDMADNANKMGTAMSSIQDAYQGFAKQNYTMLDNLKLGYGGTAGEMARLINDSGVLGDTMTVTADTVNNVSFDQMVQAIHVVQENMGITGTTALEAADTVQGSANSMKASWENLLTGLADPTQNFNQLISNLVDSVGTYASNLAPVIQNAVNGFSDLAGRLAPMIPGIVEQLAQAITSGSTIQQFTTAILQVVNGIVKSLPTIIKALLDMLMQVVQGVISELPTLLISVVEAIMELATMLTQPEYLQQIMQAGLELLLALVDAIPDMIVALIEALPTIIENIINFLNDPATLEMIINAAVRLFMGLVEGILQVAGAVIAAIGNLIGTIVGHITEGFSGLWQWLMETLTGIGEFFGSVFEGVWNTISGVVDNIKNAFQGAWDFVTSIFGKVGQWFKDRFNEAYNGIKSIFDNIVSFFQGIWDKTVEIFTGIAEGIGNAVKNAISGAINFVIGAIEGFINGVINAINGLIDGVNSVSEVVGVHIDHLSTISLGRVEFAKGGIVPGTSYYGDRVPALVNSGEMVITRAQQAALWNAIDSGELGGGAPAPNNSLDSIERILANAFGDEYEGTVTTDDRPLTVYMENNIDNSLDIDQVGNELLAQIRRVA